MAPSSAIHFTGPTGIAVSSPYSSSEASEVGHPRRSVFFGQAVGSKIPPLLKFSGSRSLGTRRRQIVGPVRVVSEKVVGIDLGTTNSAVAAMEGGKPTIVTNAEGQRTTPSVVAYTKSGDRLVGQIAKRQAVVNPENTFFSVKRFIGRKMSEVDEEAKQVSYKVVRDANGNVKLECPAIGKQFAAEEISAQVCVAPSAYLFITFPSSYSLENGLQLDSRKTGLLWGNLRSWVCSIRNSKSRQKEMLNSLYLFESFYIFFYRE